MAKNYFKVRVSTTVGPEQERVIGPYEDDELNEYGEPDDDPHIEEVVWELINVAVLPTTEEEARREGLL